MAANHRGRGKTKSFEKQWRKRQLRRYNNAAPSVQVTPRPSLQVTLPKTSAPTHPSGDRFPEGEDLRWTISWQGRERSGRQSEVSQLAEEALYCMEEDPERAAQLLRKATQLEPDGEDLWNNLAEALDALGVSDEAKAIDAMVRSRYPNYFFAIIREIRQALDDADLIRASQLLNRLHERETLHITEFRALVTSEIELATLQGSRQAAKAWIAKWREVEFHPMQDQMETQLDDNIYRDSLPFLSFLSKKAGLR